MREMGSREITPTYRDVENVGNVTLIRRMGIHMISNAELTEELDMERGCKKETCFCSKVK